jgi:hypothetical protein
VSPMVQMSACVPEYFEAFSTKWRACTSVIVRGAFYCASCACASSARAFASAIAARDASASAESRAVSLLRTAIRSNAAAVSLFASAISVLVAGLRPASASTHKERPRRRGLAQAWVNRGRQA